MRKSVTFSKVLDFKLYFPREPSIYVITDLDQKAKTNFNNYSYTYSRK